MADPVWIKKTVVLSVVLALPALVLLARVWRNSSRGVSQAQSLACWMGIAFFISYFCWFLNVAFGWSVGFMIAWPLIGIVLSILGCGSAFLLTRKIA